jgi:hypothetical protein
MKTFRQIDSILSGVRPQGTNQRSLELASVERDVFVVESVGAEIDFERGASDKWSP